MIGSWNSGYATDLKSSVENNWYLNKADNPELAPYSGTDLTLLTEL